ncbi:unnamed protein product [Didymodactylos carnosus]|uniref:Glycosyltransferase 2-like domain-containing protein n=1 Tax=Didymodactylos carnosus TaxID=1234261 RepID=A0A813Y480_9BILA|nr:unnamed protein product [Didymodactylos carnosus]CAF0945213.1 unnamed protein product [Didymodactylos carnosus]CAF3666150.1 unnamed protein product [Didymodactylos carnosus]CAF3719888.1 unnamed protein product [Didymodactylos carnosus]
MSNEKLMISVVTPSHNRLEYLKVAIMSVQVQVLAPLPIEFEHVIHDCGSTDGTKEYFEQNLPKENIYYIKDDGTNKPDTKNRQLVKATEDKRKDGKGELADNIIFIRSEHKMPPSQARNICIRKTRGQFICVLITVDFYILQDDDDVFLQRCIHNFAHAIRENKNKQFFISDFLRVNEHLQYMPKEDYYGWVFKDCKEMLQAIFDSCHFIQGNVCYSKKLFDDAGEYDETIGMAEDLDLYVRFLIHGDHPVYLPVISHLHRMHTANFSIGCDRDKHHNDLRGIYGRNEQKLKSLGVELTLSN